MEDEASWRAFVEQSPIGMVWVDPDGHVLWANQAQLDLIGETREAYVGSHVGPELFERLRPGEPVRGFATTLPSRGGALRHIVVDANPFRRHGKLVHSGCFVRDVTEQHTADRMKDELLATVSHELRTPLNAILGWARLLRTGNVDPRKHEKAVATIERNAAAQARLIDELLDLARIANHKLTLDVHPIELGDVVSSAVESMRPAADGKGVHISCVVAPEIGPFLGDKSRLSQVLFNLVHNAVKFTPGGGEVHVRLSRIDDHAVIVVSDTGQGIAPEFLPLVFDRFRQAESGINRVHGGLGLGLAITRHLVEAHGGRVEAASDGPGSGSTFRVLLPLVEAPHEGPTKSSIKPVSAALEGVRVLVVDHDGDAREVIGEALRMCGAAVSESEGSQHAIELIRRSPPDVLVADVALPLEDGYTLIERVRAIGLDLPACALTAHARLEDRERALAAGFDLHVTKPVDPGELCDAVARLAGARDRG